MPQYNFDLLILTEKQAKIFKKFMNNDSVFLTYEEYKLMSDTSLLKQAISGKSTWFDGDFAKGGTCELSSQGEKYRAYLKNLQTLTKQNSVRFWIPLIISNLIATASLIFSILTYLN